MVDRLNSAIAWKSYMRFVASVPFTCVDLMGNAPVDYFAAISPRSHRSEIVFTVTCFCQLFSELQYARFRIKPHIKPLKSNLLRHSYPNVILTIAFRKKEKNNYLYRPPDHFALHFTEVSFSQRITYEPSCCSRLNHLHKVCISN